MSEELTDADRELLEIKKMNDQKPAGVPEAKITIFIEMGDRIKKIEIPHARYLGIEKRYKADSDNGIQFSLKCDPQYDMDRNCYLTEEIRTVETDPKKAANEEREARWKTFLSSYDLSTRLKIINVGPKHPNHPDHTHEDCCK